MPNLLFFEGGVQGTSLGEIRANQLVTGGVKHPTSLPFLPDTNEPIFNGIVSVVSGPDGDMTVDWNAATGTSEPPTRYRVYVALGTVTPAALFVQINVAAVVESPTQIRLFTLGDGQTVFQEGLLYTFGVRAVSAIGIAESNEEIITVVSTSTGNPAEILQGLVARLEKSASILIGSGGTTLSVVSQETTMSFSGKVTKMSIEMDEVP
jgi:hypothetical protein